MAQILIAKKTTLTYVNGVGKLLDLDASVTLFGTINPILIGGHFIIHKKAIQCISISKKKY